MKNPLSEQYIINFLNMDYGIKVAKLIFLPIGADMNASIYKAYASTQSSYFVKLKRGHNPDISTIIIALLHSAGIQEVILPIKTNSSQSTLNIDDSTLIVYPFIEGHNGFNYDLTAKQWITLGKTIKQIHEINVPQSVQAMIPRETYSPQWRNAVRALYTHIESEPSGDEIALKLIKFMKKNSEAIHQLVDRAEQLSQKIQKQSPKFVLCHSDIHGGNVLIDKNDSIYIVDWDEAIMAPKERDLMFIGGGVANVWNKPHEEELFYQGYGKTEIDRTILAYYRHERIVEDIAHYGQQLLLSTTGGQDRIESYKHFIAQFEPRGVVEIAFKTDNSTY